jgi:YD repeat-containing protein
MMSQFATAIVALVIMTNAAVAQQRTLYDSHGRVVGRSTVDSAGSITNYDSRGRVITRESTDSAGTTSIFDARTGRVIGRDTHNGERK